MMAAVQLIIFQKQQAPTSKLKQYISHLKQSSYNKSKYGTRLQDSRNEYSQ